MQRTSSDLKLNPHVHAVFLDGVVRDEEEILPGTYPLNVAMAATVVLYDRLLKAGLP